VVVPGLGVLGTSGEMTARPTASTAKIMTALLVLEDHPLQPGEAGPLVTVTAQDVVDYQMAAQDGQSVVPVTVGEQPACRSRGRLRATSRSRRFDRRWGARSRS
jgi:D-alanyl-D-alanine carboxypeptidase (penicillin-binding protein 5/6)